MLGSEECVYKNRGKVWETECGSKFNRKMIRKWLKECEEEAKEFTCIRCRKLIKTVPGGVEGIAMEEGECCYQAEDGGKFWKTECEHRFNGEFMMKWVKECEGGDFFCPVCRKAIVVWD
jgi:hypothetical protein